MPSSFQPLPEQRPLCRLCEERPPLVRGLCRRCRQGVRRDVAAGRVTEAELMGAGLLLPDAKGRRRSTPPWRLKIDQVRNSAPPAAKEEH